MSRPDPRTCHYCAIDTIEKGLALGVEFEECCKTHDPKRYVCVGCRRLDEAYRDDHDPKKNPLVSVRVTYEVHWRADEFWEHEIGSEKPEHPTADDVIAALKERYEHGKFDWLHDSEITLGDPEVEFGCGSTAARWDR